MRWVLVLQSQGKTSRRARASVWIIREQRVPEPDELQEARCFVVLRIRHPVDIDIQSASQASRGTNHECPVEGAPARAPWAREHSLEAIARVRLERGVRWATIRISRSMCRHDRERSVRRDKLRTAMGELRENAEVVARPHSVPVPCRVRSNIHEKGHGADPWERVRLSDRGGRCSRTQPCGSPEHP